MTLEELKEKYPIDGEHNVYYSCFRKPNYSFWETELDKKILKSEHPYGYFYEDKYFYYDCFCYTWYDSYFYLDNKWFLEKDTWDGIIQAEEPSYELNRFEYSAKTKKDVVDFIKDKLDITKF